MTVHSFRPAADPITLGDAVTHTGPSTAADIIAKAAVTKYGDNARGFVAAIAANVEMRLAKQPPGDMAQVVPPTPDAPRTPLRLWFAVALAALVLAYAVHADPVGRVAQQIVEVE